MYKIEIWWLGLYIGNSLGQHIIKVLEFKDLIYKDTNENEEISDTKYFTIVDRREFTAWHIMFCKEIEIIKSESGFLIWVLRKMVLPEEILEFKKAYIFPSPVTVYKLDDTNVKNYFTLYVCLNSMVTESSPWKMLIFWCSSWK